MNVQSRYSARGVVRAAYRRSALPACSVARNAVQSCVVRAVAWQECANAVSKESRYATRVGMCV